MLSNHSPTRAYHRRQNSVPVQPGMESHAPQFPTPYRQPRPMPAHRRGLSLDPSMTPPDFQQQPAPGTPTTTTSSATTPMTHPLHGTVSINRGHPHEQQILREAQTHGPSRPGHTPTAGPPYGLMPGAPIPPAIMQNISEEAAIELAQQPLLVTDPAMIEAMAFQAATGAPSMLAQIPTPFGIDMMAGAPGTPQTPDKNMLRGGIPLTPAASRSRSSRRAAARPLSMFEIDYHLAKEQALLPLKRSNSHQESLAMQQQAAGAGLCMPTPPHTAPLNGPVVYELEAPPPMGFLDVTALKMDLAANAGSYNSSNYSPMTTRTSPGGSSMMSSPELGPVSLFGSTAPEMPMLLDASHQHQAEPARRGRVASPKKKAIQMPETTVIEETGVTSEQVDAFIQGPDPETKEYTCLYEGCKFKPFARKENIRSHIQTHLGDRKFVCGVCRNRFVRPNDLKRHAVIHEQTKSYTCICGAAFGRKDALRRHRCRSVFCAQGDPTLDVLQREEKKRGRPKKIAPTETAERRERKANIRRQVIARQREGSLQSSTSSRPSPPPECSSPEATSLPLAKMQAYSPAADLAFTPPMSPEETAPSIGSPTLLSKPSPIHRDLSPPPTRGSMTASGHSEPTASFEGDPIFGLNEFAANAADKTLDCPRSPYGSPPDLDPRSSSQSSRFLDFEGSSTASATTQFANDLLSQMDLPMAHGDTADMFPLFQDALVKEDMVKTQTTFLTEANAMTDPFWDSI